MTDTTPTPPMAPGFDPASIDIDRAAPLPLLDAVVTAEAVDYNGHMTESHFHVLFGQAVDRLLVLIGIDAAYVEAGCSCYNVEAHVRYIREIGLEGRLHVTSQILGVDEKRIHMFHRMHRREDDALLATAEQMYLHVDRRAGRAAPMQPAVRARIRRIHQAQRALPLPDDAGRAIRSL